MKTNKKSNIGEYLILLILLIMIVGMSFARPVFLSSDNLLNIARQISMVAIVGIGMTFVLIIGEIDLSVGHIACLSGIMVSICLRAGISIPYENIGMLIFVTCLNAITGFGFAPQLSMIADAIDFQEEKTGVRSDGIAFAVYGLATKLGGAIGSSVGIIIITAFGYVAGQAVTASAQTGINFTANLFCGLLHLVAAAIPLLFWKMTDKDADDIRERLRVRNASAE